MNIKLVKALGIFNLLLWENVLDHTLFRLVERIC